MSGPALHQLQHLVNQGDLRAALETLNSLAGCRFTAFFRFGEDGLRNLVLVDRQDRQAQLLDTVPVHQSYCAFVQQSKDAFVVADSRGDDRLGDHVKRPLVKSYFGYPVKVDGATVFGTVCHFDFDVVAVPEAVLDLTRRFAEGFDTTRAMDELHARLHRRLDSLALMGDAILQAATSRAEVSDAFAEYAMPLLDDAERLLDPAALQAYRASVAGLQARLEARAVELP